MKLNILVFIIFPPELIYRTIPSHPSKLTAAAVATCTRRVPISLLLAEAMSGDSSAGQAGFGRAVSGNFAPI